VLTLRRLSNAGPGVCPISGVLPAPPQLARQPHYAQQIRERIAELGQHLERTEAQVAAGRLDLEPAAGITRREITWLGGLLE